jgi:hypothetical protein
MKMKTPDKTGLVLAAVTLLVFMTPAAIVSGAAGDGSVGCLPQAASFAGTPAPLSESLPLTGAGTNMANNGRPASQRPALLVLPPIIKPDNTDSRLRGLPVSGAIRIVSMVDRHQPHDVLTSTSLVCSTVGRRVTLVGAKPSGTS